MADEYFEATHRLKRTFNGGEDIHRKGSPVYIPKGNQHFNGNVFFLTPTGRVKTNKDHRVQLYSKSFFKPRKDWFEKIETKELL